MKTALQSAVERAIKTHGGVRAAGRALGIDPAYIIRMRDGVKTRPSDAILAAVGLRKSVKYERL